MLTAELVKARKRNGQLFLVNLDGKTLSRARDLAATFLAIAEEHIDKTREELDAALNQVPTQAQEQRLAAGFRKLVEDRCEFQAVLSTDPTELRREVFLRASAARFAPRDEGQSSFDREAILGEVASAYGITAQDLERALYADLKGAHTLLAFRSITADALVNEYSTAQAQAVLLRAVRVVVDIECASAHTYRALFHKLKFLRLLYTITKNNTEEGYHIEIDGPFSIFESVTKYGLQLALLLPTLEGCDRWRLHADIRWGKEREPLVFQLEGAGRSTRTQTDSGPRVSPEVQALIEGFQRLKTPWVVSFEPALLQLPGVGLCVPDLVFHRPDSEQKVFLEVMGFWSREAVWKRVELVQKGLEHRILFAVSERLRVSEAVLDSTHPSALYVYKGSMSPRLIAERLDQLCQR